MKKYFIDLFAGCGGLSLGLEQAGFTPALVNELNQDAMETYLKNRDTEYPLLREKYSINDVKELVNNDDLVNKTIENMMVDYGLNIKNGDLDLLVGGPPCQGFSGIGHRRSYSVEKNKIPSNHLYEDMIVLIKKFNPKIFLFENVRGILSGKWSSSGIKGEIWKDVLNAFSSISNYTIRWKLLYAKDYGVPQNRPRVILIGIRNDIINTKDIPQDAIDSGFLPSPTYDYPNIVDLLSDLVDENYTSDLQVSQYVNSFNNNLQKQFRTNKEGKICLDLTEQEYSNHSDNVIKKFEYMLRNDGKIPEEFKTKKFSQRVIPAIWDKNGPNITATSAPDDYVHYCQPRSLTVREWARLQFFPDWYQFSGSRTTGGLRRAGNPQEGIYTRELPKYTQIGNAVPVLLAKKIGENLITFL